MIKIYMMTHRKCAVPGDGIYIPMQVGSALHEYLGYLRDDTGENISEKNPCYSELTGMYWMWKNEHQADILGICHYRRFLIDADENLLNSGEIENILSEYDLITTRQIQLNCTYYDGFAADHHQKDIDAVADVIRQFEPAYYDTFMRTVHDSKTYFGNMMITSKKVFSKYAEWLFGIFDRAEKKINTDGYNGYEKRVYGFISEILLLVWTRVNKIRVYECRVGMLGEKKETAELKEKLSDYFRKKDFAGAKEYFLGTLAVRPDVLMEASDVNGDLKAAMQVIATAEYESDSGKHSIFEETTDFSELTAKIKRLNAITERRQNNLFLKDDDEYLKAHEFSSEAVMIAQQCVR